MWELAERFLSVVFFVNYFFQIMKKINLTVARLATLVAFGAVYSCGLEEADKAKLDKIAAIETTANAANTGLQNKVDGAGAVSAVEADLKDAAKSKLKPLIGAAGFAFDNADAAGEFKTLTKAQAESMKKTAKLSKFADKFADETAAEKFADRKSVQERFLDIFTNATARNAARVLLAAHDVHDLGDVAPTATTFKAAMIGTKALTATNQLIANDLFISGTTAYIVSTGGLAATGAITEMDPATGGAKGGATVILFTA